MGFGYECVIVCSKALFWQAGVADCASELPSPSLAGSRMARIAQIVSTARYLPPHLVSNAELTERFTALGRPHVIDKLAASTGISKRFYVPDDWVTSDLALMAAKEALNRTGRHPQPIDFIALCTNSPH